MKISTLTVLFAAAAMWPTAQAQPRAIDTSKSVMTVKVFKAGVLSAFGHDHEIAAPIASGTVDTNAHKVELRTKAASLKVEDKDTSDKDRAQIQSTMTGPEVLDVEHHAEIAFRSTSAEEAGGGWQVHGQLTLHGQTRPVVVEVREESGHYIGTARLKQSDFDIKPVKVAGGTVRVKDEVRIEFNIVLAR